VTVMHRRGVLPVLVLLVLVLVGVVLQIVRGPAAATPAGSAAAGARATPASTSAARGVLRSLAAVERAYDAHAVQRLCRPGVLVDPAVIRAQNARRMGCESEIESLMANVPRLRVTVRELAVGRALATADVVTPSGAGASVDFVRRGGRWLLSFSSGHDPMPALAGTA
jgi:hypothetical protein